MKIRKVLPLGNCKSCPNLVSELPSDEKTPQEKANNIFRLFRNKIPTKTKTKIAFHRGLRLETGTSGFRNNHLCAEKKWFKRRSKLWKTAPGLTIEQISRPPNITNYPSASPPGRNMTSRLPTDEKNCSRSIYITTYAVYMPKCIVYVFAQTSHEQ